MFCNPSNRKALLSHQDDGEMLPQSPGVFNLHKSCTVITKNSHTPLIQRPHLSFDNSKTLSRTNPSIPD